MIEPAKYEGGGDEGIEPDVICTVCLICLTCLGCGACTFCDCVTEPLSDIGKAAWVDTADLAHW